MHYKKIEAILFRYNRETVILNDYRLELEYLEVEAGISGISYEERISSGQVTNEVEQAYLKFEKKHREITLKIIKLEKKLRKIANALKGLTEEEQYIITAFYFEGKQWFRIAIEIHKSESACKEIRRRAICKMEAILNGGFEENKN